MRALALALVVAGAVSGCGGSSSSAPRTLPAVSPSVSPTAAASAATVEVPAAARAADSAGAEAFARFFYAEVERAFAKKDPEIVRRLGAPGSTTVAAYVKSIERLRDRKERVDGYSLRIIEAVAPAVQGTEARVDVSWRSGKMTRLDAHGAVISTEGPFNRVNEQVNLVWLNGAWRLTTIRSLGR